MSVSSFLRCLTIAGAGLLSASCSAPAQLDIVIENALLYDGTGATPRRATIGIKGDRIALVAPPDTKLSASRRIDAAALAIAPGFIDSHSHVPEALASLDGPMLDEQDLSQGVTTILASPDGELSPSQMRDLAAELVRRGSGPNFACYVGHNGIRREVMSGQRRAATDEEVAQMAALVRQGMAMGCVGLSTGLMYEPGMYASEAEVQALAREVKPYGGSYDSHTRNPVAQMLESENEAIRLGHATGLPVKLAHLKAVGHANRGRIGEVIALVEAARARGLDVVADQYPFDGATLRYVSELFLRPEGGTVPRDRLHADLGNPARRAAIRKATELGVDGGFSWVKVVGYGAMRVVDAPDASALIGRQVDAIAGEMDEVPFETLVRLATAHEGVRLTLGSIEESDIRALIVRPWVMIASDGFYADELTIAAGKAHPRSWGSFTRVLGHYSRDLKLLALEEAIRKMTSLPADHLGLADRGRIAVGKMADIVIFDPASVDARATYLRPSARSSGIVTVLVNGVVTFEEGKLTGAAPGRFVRRGSPPQ